MSAQIRVGSPCKWLVSTYRFLCDVETSTYDLSKSVLIDAESLKHKPSIIVAALVTVAIELNLQLLHGDPSKTSNSFQARASTIYPTPPVNTKILPILDHLKICNQVWDGILRKIFGPNSIENLEQFGRYLVLRQQRIYRAFNDKKLSIREQQICELRNIYKERSKKLYDHAFFDLKQNCSSGSRFDSAVTLHTQ